MSKLTVATHFFEGTRSIGEGRAKLTCDLDGRMQVQGLG